MSSSDSSSQASDQPDAGVPSDSSPVNASTAEDGIASSTSKSQEAPSTQSPHDSGDPAPAPSEADPSSPTVDPSLVSAPAPEAVVENPASPAPPDPEAVVAAVEPVPPPAQNPQVAASVRSALAARLPNASVGKPYHRSVRALFGEQASRVANIFAAVPENCGLSFDETSETIQGTPTKPGEFNLELAFHLAPTAPGRPALTQEVALTINPDPTSLWQNKPSDAAGPFAKPDFDKASLSTPQLSAIAASLRGRSHAHEGKYREDDFAMRLVEETGWHLFIVADGAGSAKFSRRGSQIACTTAVSKLAQWLMAGNDLDEALEKLAGSADHADGLEKLRRIAYNPLVTAAYEAFLSVRKEADEHKATLRDFATTFITVISRRVGSQWFFASFAIGDGGAGVMIAPGKLQPLTKPDSGEFAGQTVFLTMSQVFQDQAALLNRAQAAFCEDFRFLAVMTDGITDPIFQNDAAFLSAGAWEKWKGQLDGVVNLEALTPGMEEPLLQWLNFPSPGNHDDRTLILAVPQKTVSPA